MQMIQAVTIFDSAMGILLALVLAMEIHNMIPLLQSGMEFRLCSINHIGILSGGGASWTRIIRGL